MTTSDSPALKI